MAMVGGWESLECEGSLLPGGGWRAVASGWCGPLRAVCPSSLAQDPSSWQTLYREPGQKEPKLQALDL